MKTPALPLFLGLVAPLALYSANTFQVIEDFEGGRIALIANDVSADGTVVVGRGEIADPDDPLDDTGSSRAFTWTASGGLVNLGVLAGGTRSHAYAVSADGTIITGESTSILGYATGFRKIPSVAGLQFIIDPVTANPEPRLASLAISDDGVYTGGFFRNDDDQVEAFRWSLAGGFEELGPIIPGSTRSQNRVFSWVYDLSADGSIVVGAADAPESSGVTPVEGYHYNLTTETVTRFGYLPGARFNYSRANAVTPDGSTAVGYAFSGNRDAGDAADGVMAIRWTAAGGMEPLGFFSVYTDTFGKPSFRSEANDISADGSVIVGVSKNSAGQDRAFVWDEVNGMRDLAAALNLPAEIGDYALIEATGVSADGSVIVGILNGPDIRELGFIAKLDPGAVLSPFETWKAGVFSPAELADDTISGVAADDEGDQKAVLLEYGTGTSPKDVDPRSPVTLVEAPDGLIVSFRANETYTDIVYRLLAGPAIPAATALATITPGGGGSGVSVATDLSFSETTEGAWTTVTLTIPFSALAFEGNGRGFVQLEIELQ